MIHTSLFFLFLTALLALGRRHRQLSRHALVRRQQRHGITIELRRHCHLERCVPDAFPQPREERLLTWRVLGLPVHTQRFSVGLPLGSDSRLGHIGADEFDRCFPPHYRVQAPAPQAARTRLFVSSAR